MSAGRSWREIMENPPFHRDDLPTGDNPGKLFRFVDWSRSIVLDRIRDMNGTSSHDVLEAEVGKRRRFSSARKIRYIIEEPHQQWPPSPRAGPFSFRMNENRPLLNFWLFPQFLRAEAGCNDSVKFPLRSVTAAPETFHLPLLYLHLSCTFVAQFTVSVFPSNRFIFLSSSLFFPGDFPEGREDKKEEEEGL